MSEIVMHLSAGKGPAECRWVVAQLAKAFQDEAANAGIKCEVLDAADELPPSLLLRLCGDQASAFAQQRIGTILWIGQSPFRPHHRRRNWFVGATLAPSPADIPDLRDVDIDFQTMRASGPGGQHVNKTDSAVRAIHRITGLTVTAQEQRSQFANRKLAKLKLALLLQDRRDQAGKDADAQNWMTNQSLERGNPTRTYAGPRFKLKRIK